MNTHFNETLPQNAANFEALTPIQFMERYFHQLSKRGLP